MSEPASAAELFEPPALEELLWNDLLEIVANLLALFAMLGVVALGGLTFTRDLVRDVFFDEFLLEPV